MMRVWTREEIEKAIRLKERLGIDYAVTAERMGVSAWNLRQHVRRYRQGTWTFDRTAKNQSRTAEVEAMIARGASVVEMARHFGLSLPGMSNWLTRNGFDREMREEMRSAA